jgi:hypothetical protein
VGLDDDGSFGGGHRRFGRAQYVLRTMSVLPDFPSNAVSERGITLRPRTFIAEVRQVSVSDKRRHDVGSNHFGRPNLSRSP